MTRTRSVLVTILLIFALYAILNSPQQAADVVTSAFDQIAEWLRAVGEFFDGLLTG